MIVFITSIYDVLKTQIKYFIKVAVTLFILYDEVRTSAVDKVVTVAGEVLFERKPPTSSKPEANELTFAYQVNQKYLVHRKTSYFQLDETRLEFSRQIDDDCRFDQQFRTGKYRTSRLVSHPDSEIHAEQNGNLERHEVSKIEDRL